MNSKIENKVRRLLDNYIESGYSAAMEAKFAEWLTAPYRREEKEKALAGLWDSFASKNDTELYSALYEIKKRLGHPLPPKKPIRRRFPRIAAVLVPLAAVLILVFFITRRSPEVIPPPTVLLSVAAFDSMCFELLPDSSCAWVNAVSSLAYSVDHENKRHAHMEGEVFFNVMHIDSSVFEVHTPKLDIRVLGTEFNVREHAGEFLSEIILYEGSIEVMAGTQSLKMEPGNMLTYDHQTEQIRFSTIPNDHINWRFGILDFESEDIASILRSVARYYGYDIIMPESDIPSDPITIRFDGTESFEHTMFLLERLSRRFTYHVNGQTIIINFN